MFDGVSSKKHRLLLIAQDSIETHVSNAYVI